MGVNDDKTGYSCTILRPSGTTYLYIENWTIQLTGATIEHYGEFITFWPKIFFCQFSVEQTRFAVKLSIFFIKIWLFDKNYRFLTRLSIFDQIFGFWPNFGFLTKFLVFDQTFDFWSNFQFLTKLSIFDQIFGFWPNFRCLIKFSIFDQTFYFWPNFRFFTKLSIFDQIFDFWPNFRFFIKILILPKRLISIFEQSKKIFCSNFWQWKPAFNQ